MKCLVGLALKLKSLVFLIMACLSMNGYADSHQRILHATETIFSTPFEDSDGTITLQWHNYQEIEEEHFPIQESEVSTTRLSEPLPIKRIIDSYQLILTQEETEETIWNIEIVHPVLKIRKNAVITYQRFEAGAEPDFEMLDVRQDGETIWIFYWTDGKYRLDAQQKTEETWENVMTVPLERKYEPSIESKIFIDDLSISVHFISKDGSMEQWELQDKKLIKRKDFHQ
jgi:hypothetical protein